MSKDILQNDDRGIDDHPYPQGESRQCDYIEGFSSEAYPEDGDEDGGSDLTITLKGDELDSLISTAREIEELLATEIEGIIDSGLNMSDGLPQVEIAIDRHKAYDLGLNSAAIATEIRAQLSGTTATNFTQDGTTYDVVVKLRDEDLQEIPDLEKIFVLNRSGEKIPVSSFASLVENEGPVSINHSDGKRSITVGATLHENAAANLIDRQVRELVESGLSLPQGITLELGGENEDLQETASGLMMILILAAILVFGVMVSQFESLKAPFVVILSMPMLAVGVIGIYLIMGTDFSMVSFIGVIMLSGIVVNNGIVLVDYISLLRKRGMQLMEACLKASISRLRPILMTTLTTILAMVPLAFFSGEGGAMMQPLGVTVVGGLSVNTLVTLIIVPVLYSVFFRKDGKVEIKEEQGVLT